MGDLPKQIVAWMGETGAAMSAADHEFIEAVDRLSRQGVGFGFMQQVCEWRWQEFAERMGFPGSAWGPEYFHRRIAELEAALRPFALLAADNPDTPAGVPVRFWNNTEPDRPAVEPTMADCRRAAVLLGGVVVTEDDGEPI